MNIFVNLFTESYFIIQFFNTNSHEQKTKIFVYIFVIYRSAVRTINPTIYRHRHPIHFNTDRYGHELCRMNE